MPSKRLKSQKKADSPSSAERVYSESELSSVAEEVLSRAGSSTEGLWVFLEGELGAGKTALASQILRRLGHPTGGEGSPTFPLAHEYVLGERGVCHLDLYRIKSEAELEMTGLLELFGGSGVVLVEWASLFPALFSRIRSTADDLGVRIIDVDIKFAQETDQRRFRITWSTGSVLHGTVPPRRSGSS